MVSCEIVGTERKSESTKAFVVDEEEGGLPAPPLEDLPFLFSQTTSKIELSQVCLTPYLSSTKSFIFTFMIDSDSFSSFPIY